MQDPNRTRAFSRSAVWLLCAAVLACSPAKKAGGQDTTTASYASDTVDTADAPDAMDIIDIAASDDAASLDASPPLDVTVDVAKDAMAKDVDATAADAPDASDAAFDPNAGMPPGYAWKHMAPMHIARADAKAVWGNGYLYVFGGKSEEAWGNDPNALPPYSDGLEVTLERYDPKADAWELLPPAPVYPSSFDLNIAWGGDRLYVYSGHDPNNKFIGPTQWTAKPVVAAMYLPEAATWVALPEKGSPGSRVEPCAVWADSGLFVWGDRFEVPQAPGATYEPASNEWKVLPTVPPPSTETDGAFSAVWTGARVALFTSKTGLEYDPLAKVWSTFPHHPGPLVPPQDPQHRFFTNTAPIPGGFIGMTKKNSSSGPADPLFQIWTHKDGAQTFDAVPVPKGFEPVDGNFVYQAGIACWVLMSESLKSSGACGGLASGIWQSITSPQPYGRDTFAIAPMPGGVAFVGGYAGGTQYGSYYIAKDGWLLQTPATGGNP